MNLNTTELLENIEEDLQELDQAARALQAVGLDKVADKIFLQSNRIHLKVKAVREIDRAKRHEAYEKVFNAVAEHFSQRNLGL